MRRVFCNLVFAITITGFMLVNSIQPASAASIDEKLDRLERLLQQQQQQIESQSRTIQQLEEKLEKMTTSAPAASATTDQQMAQSGKPAVQSGNEKVNVKLYGQLNRGVLLVDDGDSTNTYQVDNDNSSTRVGLLGSVNTIEDWTIGTKFEVEFESNSSSAVDQDNQNGVGGDSFNERWADIFINSPYGKLSVGQGDTASNNTSEIDLSGTTVAGYSDPNSNAGGQFFYDDSTKMLSGTRVKNVFSNFDGLSRDDRIRYDTPEWRGLKLATSAVSGDGGDSWTTLARHRFARDDAADVSKQHDITDFIGPHTQIRVIGGPAEEVHAYIYLDSFEIELTVAGVAATTTTTTTTTPPTTTTSTTSSTTTTTVPSTTTSTTTPVTTTQATPPGTTTTMALPNPVDPDRSPATAAS